MYCILLSTFCFSLNQPVNLYNNHNYFKVTDDSYTMEPLNIRVERYFRMGSTALYNWMIGISDNV